MLPAAIAPAPDPRVSALSLHSPIAIPTNVFEHGVLFLCGNHVFNTLFDTAATDSVVDPAIIPMLHLQSQVIAPADPSDVITLANGSTVPRIGTVRIRFKPVTVGLKDSSALQLLPEYTHLFEIMPLQPEHQFVLGRELIREFWPESIPTALIPPTPLAGIPQRSINAINAHASTLINLPNISPSAPDPSVYPIQQGLDKHKLHILIKENNQLESMSMSDTEGLGGVSFDEEPIKVHSLTPAEFEQEFAAKRVALSSSPEFQRALTINERITGVCNLPESVLKIELDSELGTPVKLHQNQYKLAHALLEPAGMVIDRWLAEGKIKLAPVDCPYNTPVMVAPKKDEHGTMTGIRVCLDLRRLNKAVRSPDQFQIPHIRSALDLLSGCTIFGEFDLAEAYLQVRLHPDSQPLTAFTWGRKKYMYTVCPFGLTQMPSHFQRLMTYIFRDFTCTLPYFDNIPFGSTSWEDHAIHALAIVERLNSFNMRIKPSSVKVGQAQLNCLGHLITRSGIAIASDKLAKLASWPPPRDGKQMASFLGFATFLRQHVRHFGDLTADLESLKRLGKSAITWTPSLTRSFDLVRKAIATAPLLAFPDFNKQFRIATDASCVGIGGVLYQCDADDGIGVISPDNIIAICSKKLNDTQRRYSTYKKELYAMVYCLRQFHAWIWGHELTIITDHMPLTHIQTTPTLAPAMQQWLDVILDYKFNIVHCPGVTNVLADSLSRMYEALYDTAWGVPTKDRQSIIKELDLKLDLDATATPDAPRSRVPSRGQQLDPAPAGTQRLVAAVSFGKGGGKITISPPASDVKRKQSFTNNNNSKPKRARRSLDLASWVPSVSSAAADALPVPVATKILSTSMVDTASTRTQLQRLPLTAEQRETSLLVELERRGKSCPDTVSERNELIDKSHLFGHFGRDVIYRQLSRDGYWWPGMRDHINERTRECVPCLRYTISRMGFDPATPITAALPWDHIQIDTSVKLPISTDGMQAMLAIVDVCTSLVLLRPMPDATAQSIARVLWKVFTDFGFPKVIQSDNGPEFVNKMISAMIEISAVEQRLITAYNPRADGKVERSIGVSMSIIKKHLHGADTSWPLFVPWAQMCINNKISSLTGSTPFALMFGRRFHPFRDYSSDAPLDSIDERELAALHDRMIEIVHPSVAERVAAQKERLVSRLDKRPRAHAFTKGTIVMLRKTNPDGSNITGKFEPVYVGPYQVASKSRHGAITLMSPTGAILPRVVRPHHLKFVSGPSKSFMEQTYEVESIMDHRGPPGNREYLVRWVGFSPAEDSWEPENNIHTDECVRAYWDTKPINTAVRTESVAAAAPVAASASPSISALSVTSDHSVDSLSASAAGADDVDRVQRRRVRLTPDQRIRIVSKWYRAYR